MGTVFKAYDIRGIYPRELDGPLVRRIGFAAGTLWRGRVVVGHDVRKSSPVLRRSLVKGLADAGCEILDAGLVCTPLIPFAVRKYQCALGISITASHNPPDYNGLKLFGRDGLPLSYDSGIAALEREAARLEGALSPGETRGSGGASAEGRVRKRIRRVPLQRDYGRFLKRSFGRFSRKLSVVVDAANGPAGRVYVSLLRGFVRVHPLHCEPDGTFPSHEPDPAKEENLADLQREVRRTGADAGFAYDGDGDRLGVVDDRGRAVPPEKVFVLLAGSVLRKRPGGRVVHDVLTSRFVDDAVRGLGGEPVECRVGHTFISQRMAEVRAAFAGELSGHYYFEETGYADDALFASLLILSTLAGDEAPLSARIDAMKNPYLSRNFRVSIPEEEKEAFMRRLFERASREHPTQTMDGVKVLLPGGWALIRPSNTEPKLSVAYEASDPEAFRAVESWVMRELGAYAPSVGKKERGPD